MSARERRERAKRAIRRGEEDRRAGVPISDCPYKRSDWGVGGFWEMGWAREDERIRREASDDVE